MVQELINRSYETKHNDGETLYENLSNTIYQNIQHKDPIYENGTNLKE